MRTSTPAPAISNVTSLKFYFNSLTAFVRRLFMLIVLVFVGAAAKAETIVEDLIVGDFGYSISSGRQGYYATLTHGVVLYGDAVIPSHITYEGVEYPVEQIGEYAFSWCNITSVTIPNTVTGIRSGAFEHCTKLSTVTIGENVINLWSNVFNDCSNLHTINCKALYPPLVFGFGNVQFSNVTLRVPMGTRYRYMDSEDWSAFVSIVEDENVGLGLAPTEVDGMSYEIYFDDQEAVLTKAKDVAHLVIPPSVTYNGKEYPVTIIDSWAIRNFSELKVLTINANIKNLSFHALEDCPNLRAVYCYAINPPDAADAFSISDCFENITLYIPKGTKDAYLADNYNDWSYFENIVEFDVNEEVILDETLTMTFEELRAAYRAMRSGDFNLDGTVTVKDITDIVDLILGKEKK